MMDIILKEMILKVKKISDSQYVREIYDVEDNLLWTGGDQYFLFEGMVVMNKEKMSELIDQMRNLPFFNIIKIENDFDLT
jgi:hypothetical protein